MLYENYIPKYRNGRVVGPYESGSATHLADALARESVADTTLPACARTTDATHLDETAFSHRRATAPVRLWTRNPRVH